MKDLTTSEADALIAEMGRKAREAAAVLAETTAERKHAALIGAAEAIRKTEDAILDANVLDMHHAEEKGLSPAMLDRLKLDPARIRAMAEGLRSVAAQADPVGKVLAEWDRPNGLHIRRVATPLGVIGVIYESRPNVTADAAALALKAGNAVILRGGSESLESSAAIHDALVAGLKQAGLPEAAIQMVPTRDREAVAAMLRAQEFIDVIVPRGGKSLIARLMEEARVPMIKHLDGICHVYVDAAADLDKAVRVCDNAKTQRYAPCNTMETLLVSRDIAAAALPPLCRIYQEKGVELRVCPATRATLEAAGFSGLVDAAEEDWRLEYLAPILAIKTVAGLDEAIAHINEYGSHHTDSIITEDYSAGMRFIREVDSASVMINASTRFADGFEYGLGAEIGISNDKLHARGPVGLEGLTSLKYVVFGHGEIRT